MTISTTSDQPVPTPTFSSTPSVAYSISYVSAPSPTTTEAVAVTNILGQTFATPALTSKATGITNSTRYPGHYSCDLCNRNITYDGH